MLSKKDLMDVIQDINIIIIYQKLNMEMIAIKFVTVFKVYFKELVVVAYLQLVMVILVKQQ